MAEYKFLDDLAKFGNTTMTAMGSLQKQVSRWVTEYTQTALKNMDLVSKDDLKASEAKTAELEARIQKLEEQFAPKAKKPKAE
jgi:BMFP domain-containing protein YqiC